MVDDIRKGEPPRRPKPVGESDVTELTREFMRHAPLPVSSLEPPRVLLRADVVRAIFAQMIDTGDIAPLEVDECHAVVELLTHFCLDPETLDLEKLPDEYPALFGNALLSAFRKLAFANGRHHGLSNFDMGIEEDAA